MTTQEVADELIAYCRKGDMETPLKELYSQDAVSIEMPGGDWPHKCVGMAAIEKKGGSFFLAWLKISMVSRCQTQLVQKTTFHVL